MKKPYWRSILILAVCIIPLLIYESYWFAVGVLVDGWRRGPNDYKRVF